LAQKCHAVRVPIGVRHRVIEGPTNRRAPDTPAAARPRPSTDGLPRYHVEVVASDVVDVVRWAGGWIFDRATAGWEVTVLVAGHCDVRPLRILGATAFDIESHFDSIDIGSSAHTLAVGADVLARNARVRGDVLHALDRRLIEVTLWGDACPVELDPRVDPAQHLLSTAARVFKAHALAAAGCPEDSVSPVETFRIGGAAYWPDDPELLPVS
jgi:hypothetical protein